MKCEEFDLLLDDYVDGELADQDRLDVERHAAECTRCAHRRSRLHALLARTAALPREIQPPVDLWSGITARLGGGVVVEGNFQRTDDRRKENTASSWKRTFLAAAVVVAALGSFWLSFESATPAWQVTSLEGAPVAGSAPVAATGALRRGEWLVTDGASRAQLDVGMIGHVQIEPNTRLRLVSTRITEQRLALARGTMHATIWAPPRIFFVETPSATAIDLGCAYTLTVDDHGGSHLHVTSGYVALELAGRESIIPAGAMCLTMPGIGPGTPFAEDASARFREALIDLDFRDGGVNALDVILAESEPSDAITLWHLLSRVEERGRVFDRLALLSPPPNGVTRDGVVNSDQKMIRTWGDQLGFGPGNWWKFW
jgi:hypothetical protein